MDFAEWHLPHGPTAWVYKSPRSENESAAAVPATMK